MLESESLVHNVGDWNIATDSIPHLAIPVTLLDSLTARLDRLGPAKEIAQIKPRSSGREFSLPLLTAVAPPLAVSLQAALARLVAAELISVSGELPGRDLHVQARAWFAMPLMPRYHGAGGSGSTAVSSTLWKALFPFTVETELQLAGASPCRGRACRARRRLSAKRLRGARSNAQLMPGCN